MEKGMWKADAISTKKKLITLAACRCSIDHNIKERSYYLLKKNRIKIMTKMMKQIGKLVILKRSKPTFELMRVFRIDW